MNKRREFIKLALLILMAGAMSTVIYLLSISKPIRIAEVKEMGAFEVGGKKIKLPPPKLKGVMSVEEAIHRRRSKRKFYDEPIKMEQLSNLLWSAQGITDPVNMFRAAPSAGATYPFEVYVVVKKGGVEGLNAGVYHYIPHEHALELCFEEDIVKELTFAALNQEWVYEAPINIVLAAVYERTTWRYGERGERYVHMEAGHIGQNIYLQATSLGLGTVVIGAFFDDRVQRLLKLPSDQKPLYILPVGKPRE